MGLILFGGFSFGGVFPGGVFPGGYGQNGEIPHGWPWPDWGLKA